MKILFISTTDNVGGAAKVCWNLGHKLNKFGIQSKFIVGYKHSNNSRVDYTPKTRAELLISKLLNKDYSSAIRLALSFLFANNIDIGSSEYIFNHPWYKEADIIHCHNLHGNYFRLDNLIRMTRDKKVIWTLHDMMPITGKCAYINNPSKWVNQCTGCNNLLAYPPMLWDNTKYLWNKKKYIYEHCSQLNLVTPSRWLANIVRSSMLSSFTIQIIPNGISTAIYHPGDKDLARKRLGLPLNKKIGLFIAQNGDLDPRKGAKYLNYVLARSTEFKNLLLVRLGDNKSVNMPNVLSLPYLKDEKEIASYYQAADFLIFPSKAENCSMVLLEAMACGLPALAFDVGGNREIVKHKKSGYLVNKIDESSYHEGLSYYMSLSDNDLHHISRSAARTIQAKFTLEQMARNYSKLYSSIL
ncbi:hypothetical protein DCC61_03865 [Candidatus Microgenomates bacterium]|nr:MAG: hypothetical protein DCC61_03865 [Candidatus Microgenomates bacterium]